MSQDFVEWKDYFSVDFEIIDNQHKELIKIINSLYLGCSMGGGAEKIVFMKALRNAVEYAQTHFYTEEKFMKQVEYHAFEAHKEAHEIFISKVKDAIKDFDDGKIEPVALATFLKDWLNTHVAEMDRKYAPFLKRLK